MSIVWQFIFLPPKTLKRLRSGRNITEKKKLIINKKKQKTVEKQLGNSFKLLLRHLRDQTNRKKNNKKPIPKPVSQWMNQLIPNCEPTCRHREEEDVPNAEESSSCSSSKSIYLIRLLHCRCCWIVYLLLLHLLLPLHPHLPPPCLNIYLFNF